jgi:DNA-binding NtrC family response regulator
MKQTLLIANGDGALCDIYRRFLVECGYAVETSSDGLNCLRKLRQAKPAVLVLDMELRWGGGDGVLAWLREESPAHGIPVILTATAGYPRDFSGSVEPPVVDFLPEPYALRALLESVRFAVANEQKRGAAKRMDLYCRSHFSGDEEP